MNAYRRSIIRILVVLLLLTAVGSRLSLADPPDSIDAVARDYGTSRDRVRQLEKRAMLRLRRKLIEAGFQLEALT